MRTKNCFVSGTNVCCTKRLAGGTPHVNSRKMAILQWVILISILSMGSVAFCYSPYGNESGGTSTKAARSSGPELPFDPNDYDFLIYDCGGGEDSITAAMSAIGLNYTVRNSSINNQVTLNDLNNHDVLIVGWSVGGNKGGLTTSVIGQGITGRVILSGHDSDYHTVNGPDYAETFFIQEIEYVLEGGGTGMIVCADVDNNFGWLPESWGVVMEEVGGGSDVSSFTQDGLDSGIYYGLDPNKMSDWGQSYHNSFKEWGDGFRPFELGYDNAGNEDKKVVTIASPVSAAGIDLVKVDDVNDLSCVIPGDEITYTISWENTSAVTVYDVNIVDDLPDEVWYEAGWDRLGAGLTIIPADPNYDQGSHSYTWEVGDLDPNETGNVSITVLVDGWAEPGMEIVNVVRMEADGVVVGWDREETLVCCFDDVDPNVIYVDESASGYNNGTSWDDAYTDLQRALRRARDSVCEVGDYTICVAEGIYSPGDGSKDVYILPDGVSLYGGFKAGGSAFSERNSEKYVTSLSGLIGVDASGIHRNEAVVYMGDDTLLDGFVVEDASDYGVYGEGVDFALENCSFSNNKEHGVFTVDCDVVIEWCQIRNNGLIGVHHEGQTNLLTIENCQVLKNGEYGIYSEDSTPTIVNSVIYGNGLLGAGRPGILILTPVNIPSLYNNTIAYNSKEAVSFADDDPNEWEREYPDIQNCILWYNNGDGEQLAGCDFTQYSCVYDPNDSLGTDYTLDSDYNFSGKPEFAYEYSEDPNVLMNLHLAYDSACKDNGSDLLSYTGQMDIDGEGRVIDTYVDIGADEIYSCDDDLTEDDIYNEVDWAADGIVNFNEFGIFARAWLSADPNNPLCDPNNAGYVSDPNDPDYISEADKVRYSLRCDIDEDLDVDLADFALFCDEWLWIACWKDSQIDRVESMAMSGQSEMMSVPMMLPMSMETEEPEPAFTSEADLVEFVKGVNEILEFLDETIENNNPGKSKQFLDIKAGLEAILEDLANSI